MLCVRHQSEESHRTDGDALCSAAAGAGRQRADMAVATATRLARLVLFTCSRRTGLECDAPVFRDAMAGFGRGRRRVEVCLLPGRATNVWRHQNVPCVPTLLLPPSSQSWPACRTSGFWFIVVILFFFRRGAQAQISVIASPEHQRSALALALLCSNTTEYRGPAPKKASPLQLVGGWLAGAGLGWLTGIRCRCARMPPGRSAWPPLAAAADQEAGTHAAAARDTTSRYPDGCLFSRGSALAG